MYAGVPTTAPVWVSTTSGVGVCSEPTWGGSVTSTAASESRARLKSRWTMPAACAAKIPRPAAMNASRMSATDRGAARSQCCTPFDVIEGDPAREITVKLVAIVAPN